METNVVVRNVFQTITLKTRLVVGGTVFDIELFAFSAYRLEGQEICPPNTMAICRVKEQESEFNSKKTPYQKRVCFPETFSEYTWWKR